MGIAALLVDPLSKIGSWSFRRRLMEIVLPWLGSVGAASLRLLEILDKVQAKSLQIFNEKKKAIEAGQVFDDGPKELITTLRKFPDRSTVAMTDIVQ